MAGLRHLIVLLPGIGGSVLERPASRHRTRRVVWDAGFSDISDLVREPAALSLAESPRLRPVGLVRSRQLLPGWTVVHGYDRLAQRFGRLPGVRIDAGHPEQRDPNADVLFFPYDFRLSITDAADRLATEIEQRLSHLSAAARVGRVVVVAHSMGGLVARYWLGPLGGWRVCRALVTLGTPHRGAPKALRWLVDGVRLGPALLDGPTELFRQWPSVAELLPRYPAIWDETADVARYPHQLPIPWVAGLAQHAYDIHQEIEKAWEAVPRNATQVFPQIGWSHGTPNAARWDGRRLTVVKEPPTWLDLAGWHDDLGDGTVPAFSALPVEMDGDGPERYRVRQRHGPLGGAASVVDLAMQYERFAPLSPARGVDGHRVAIGLDVEDSYPAGVAVPVTVRLAGATAGQEGLEVWATVRDASSPAPVQDVRLTWNADAEVFTHTVTGLPPGMYDLQITARDVPGAGDLSALDSFAVLEC